MRRLRERHPVLVGLVVIVLAVAVVVAILAAVTPQKEPAPAKSEQDRLSRGQEVVDRALGTFGQDGQGPAQKLFVASPGDLRVRGPNGESSFNPGLPAGVQVGFYRVQGRAAAYCLVSRHRHLVVQTDPTDTVVTGGRGACPRASARPIHLAN